MGKELPRTAISTLYLVEDQKCAVFLRQCAQVSHKLIIGHLYASYTLDTLNNDSGKFLGGKLLLNGCQIIKGDELHVGRFIERCLYLRIIRYGHCTRGAAVKGVAESQYLSFARVEGGELHCVLIGFSSAVAQEELIVVISARFSQAISQFDLEAVDDGVRVKAQFADLFRYCLYVVRMSMTNGDDSMSTVQIEILCPLGVVDIAPLTPDRLYII